jgi:putative DNA primase/helicase
MTNNIEQFREAIRAYGLNPPSAIEPGNIHKFPGEGKGPGSTAAWCKLFDDGDGGVFGDFTTGLSSSWQAHQAIPYTQAEREDFMRKVTEERAQRDAEEKAGHEEAAKGAQALWSAASPAAGDHPYLIRKGINPQSVRMHEGKLVIPLRDAAGKMWSVQIIDADGGKKFLPGGKIKSCYFGIGAMKGAVAMCIAEGFATGATINEATGHPVAVAFNAGNLEAVAFALRAKFPALRLIVCGDDDHKTAGNVGKGKATAAALAVSGWLALPSFGTDRPDSATDFNDMKGLVGLDAVREAIGAAQPISGEETQAQAEAPPKDNGAWPEPQPMTTSIAGEPYPLDALPDMLRAAVDEVHAFVKSPIPMVAASGLSALSLCIQQHVDVKRDDKLTGPTGLFLLTIADSGERKSSTDGYFVTAVRDYEATQAQIAKPFIRQYLAAHGAWEAKKSGVKDKIRQLAKEGKPTAESESALGVLENEQPVPPKVPRILHEDITPEALVMYVAKEWPSAGIVSSEGGIVFGSHGMSKDSAMRNLATLNKLWDGTRIVIGRKTVESFTVSGARLTMALQVQEKTIREFFSQTGDLARGTGFMARFLVSWPESSQGSRKFESAPSRWPALAQFNGRLSALLDLPAPVDENGELRPVMMELSPEAKAMWIEFHDAIEEELGDGGELRQVRDVASKTADNAVRIAALFQAFERGITSHIEADYFERASRIAAWHLSESRRFLSEFALPDDLAASMRLDTWLIEHCRSKKTLEVSRREARQFGPIREGAMFDSAIKDMTDLDRIRIIKVGKKVSIQLNPSLLEPLV